MSRVVIVGDGPGGLSAALLLAKNGVEVSVVGQDTTPMHHAHLYNYLGAPDIDGSAFQRLAREQVAGQGARLVDGEVTALEVSHDTVAVTSSAGSFDADYVVLAGGKAAQALATQLGVTDGDRVPVDQEMRTSLERVYAIGRLVRPERSQAIISAGAGATVALDILSREAGKDVHDWDTPPEG
ncbi:MAG: FAD-dependent oxidoreductase [Actinobacteria bacterium]|jgi:thioredoxin reductase|nr:FAD-dependent oxidoreductase [Actinomycetota bacterium]